jgi:hypothetical protein
MSHSSSQSSFKQDWYTPGAGGYAGYGASHLAPPPPGPGFNQGAGHSTFMPGVSSTAYGGGGGGGGDPSLNFEDEPPLLEGM